MTIYILLSAQIMIISDQFEIWKVRLDPTNGSQQSGSRPCVILQTNAGREGRTTLIAPLTSKRLEKMYPYEVFITPSRENGLSLPSKIKCDQIKVIDKMRFIKKLGVLNKQDAQNILNALEVIFDLRGDFRE